MSRSAPRSLWLLAALVIASGFAACGRSTLSIPIPKEGVGEGQGGRGGSTPIVDSGSPDVDSMDASPDVIAPDSGSDSGAPCTPDGEICGELGACCHGDCNAQSYCGPIPCRPEGYDCNTDSDCCESVCKPGLVGKQCNNCTSEGEACADAGTPCCSGFCVNAICVPPPCVENGEPVGTMLDAECCSGHSTLFLGERWCAPKKCSKDHFPCASASDCCTGQCNAGRCGPLLCKRDGEACVAVDDCCNDDCYSGLCGPAECAGNGQQCTDAVACCSNVCDAGVCVVNTCLEDAVACNTGADCCSGFCVRGLCNQAACLPEGVHCTDPTQCCVGECPANVGTCGGV